MVTQERSKRVLVIALLIVAATIGVGMRDERSNADTGEPARVEMYVFDRCGNLARTANGELATVALPLRPPPPNPAALEDPTADHVAVDDLEIPVVLGPPNAKYYAGEPNAC